jgi:hypothetical protein
MPVLADMETGLLRYATASYIAERPTTIILQRKIKVAKPGGGHDKVDSPLPAQVFRLINQTSTDGLAYSANDDGAARRQNYILVGAYDADVREDDTWIEGAIEYHVDGVLPNNGYETRASVTAFAEEPIHG